MAKKAPPQSLRIVGGILGGRRFAGPPSDATRPTAERVREAMASALEARGALTGAVVLDLFAGTGALAFEALSRGAARAWLVDRDTVALGALRRSLADLGLETKSRVASIDLLGPVSRAIAELEKLVSEPVTLLFADPPYDRASELSPLLDGLLDSAVIAPDALFVVEFRAGAPVPFSDRLATVASYRYGDTAVAFAQPIRSSRDEDQTP